MKMVFLLGIFLITTMFSFGQTESSATTAKGKEKNEQHVKVLVNKNGKVTKIDTTFNFADEKVIKLKVDSLMKKLEVVEGKEMDGNVFFIRKDGKSKMSGSAFNNGPGEEQFTIFLQDSDSGKVKGDRKVMHITRNRNYVTTFDSEGGMVPPPPPPPMPPMHVKAFKVMKDDPFAMDPNDQDIVTYDKKDIGKGLEKIVIVRKKRATEPEEKQVEVKVQVNDDQKK